MVKRAAEIEGRGVSDFIVFAAQAVARRTLEDQRRCVDLLFDAPAPDDAPRRGKAARDMPDDVCTRPSRPGYRLVVALDRLGDQPPSLS